MGYIDEKNLEKRGRNSLDFDTLTTQCWRKKNLELPIPWGTESVYTTDLRGEDFTGWDIPNYHARVRKGDLMPYTPFQRFRRSGHFDSRYDIVTWVLPSNHALGTYRYWYDFGWPNHPSWQITFDETMQYAPTSYDQYVGEAAAKIYSQGYDALTNLAELVEVRTMFVDLAKRLIKLRRPGKIFSRLLKRDKKLLVRDLLNDWMATRYGWRVFFYDLIGLNEVLKNFDEARTRYSESTGQKWTTSTTSATEYTYTFFRQWVTTVDEVTTSIRGSVTADIQPPKFQFNLLNTAWELIPLSFVFDWFLNVGKTLSSYSFLTFAHAYVASAGYRVNIKRTLTTVNHAFTDSFVSGDCYANGLCEVSFDVRRPCRVPIVPRNVVRMNSLKVMDLVAIVTQRLH